MTIFAIYLAGVMICAVACGAAMGPCFTNADFAGAVLASMLWPLTAAMLASAVLIAIWERQQ